MYGVRDSQISKKILFFENRFPPSDSDDKYHAIGYLKKNLQDIAYFNF